MTNRTTIFIGAVFIAVLMLILSMSREGTAVSPGPFQIAGQAGPGNVWMANTTTGEVRLCRPPLSFVKKPECGPWGR